LVIATQSLKVCKHKISMFDFSQSRYFMFKTLNTISGHNMNIIIVLLKKLAVFLKKIPTFNSIHLKRIY
jgi:hypothetical protein